MSSQQGNAGPSNPGSAQHDAASTTLGVGGATSGEAGATRTHETMAETGGSGGSGLTRNEVKEPRGNDEEARARQSAGDSAMNVQPRPTSGGPTEKPVVSSGNLQGGAAGAGKDERSGDTVGAGPGTDSPQVADSGARGFQDTRSEQAGGTGTGLGTPETGANQTPADLERKPEPRQ
jgi:hypothetical protein